MQALSVHYLLSQKWPIYADDLHTDKILPEFVTLKLEGLRKKRNPLVHMAEDPLGYYWKKALELNCKVEDLLEQDAKDAILLTFEIINRRPFVF